MNEENKNAITYDDDWKNVSQQEYPQVVGYESDNNNKDELKEPVKNKKIGNSQLLITIQLVACILIALSAFVLKSFGGEIYSNVRNWYYSQLNNSAIFDTESIFDLTKINGISTDDEA